MSAHVAAHPVVSLHCYVIVADGRRRMKFTNERRVYLCRVAGNTVWSYIRQVTLRSSEIGIPLKAVSPLLTFNF